jgi:hypothetical protein
MGAVESNIRAHVNEGVAWGQILLPCSDPKVVSEVEEAVALVRLS